MYEHRMMEFSQPITIIHPGEFLASGDDIIIATVLGSCVAVSLWDPVLKVGGLNHFMLPGVTTDDYEHKDPHHFASANGKYGMYAMELLINELMKMGCHRNRLVAKVFGGGSVLLTGGSSMGRVSKGNIDFAFDFLEAERIPIQKSDVGGKSARKVLFFVKDGRVLLKRITGTITHAVDQEERAYLERIRARERAAGDVTLF